jgi:hypothetical protein
MSNCCVECFLDEYLKERIKRKKGLWGIAILVVAVLCVRQSPKFLTNLIVIRRAI